MSPSSRPIANLRTCLGAGLLLLLAACQSKPGPSYSLPESYAADQVDRVVAAAKDDLEKAEDPGLAFARLELAWTTSGAVDEQRLKLEYARVDAVESYLAHLIQTEAPSRHYWRLMEADLPRNQAVRTRIARARALLREGERIKAYLAIKSMDGAYPFHAERQAAGRVLYDAGMSLARDKGKYGFFFRYRRLAPEVLEYMSTAYYTAEWSGRNILGPQPVDSTDSSANSATIPIDAMTMDPEIDPRECGPRAYATLAELYAEVRDYDLAIQRYWDLVVYYGDFPQVMETQARIPELRIQSVRESDHDRHTMILARGELENWLETYRGQDPEREEEVQRNLLHAIRQLSDHDSGVARFYRTVSNAEGANLHGRRALELALEGGSETQIADARAFLDTLRANPQAGKGDDDPTLGGPMPEEPNLDMPVPDLTEPPQ